MNHSSHIVARLTAPVTAVTLLASTALGGHSALAQSAATIPTFTPPKPAQAPAGQIPIVLGVLDTQALIYESSAGKGIITQANAIAGSYDDDFQKKENVLRAQAVQLEAKRNATPPISDADLQAGRKALGQQDDQLRQAYDKNKQSLDDRVNKARQSILTVAEKIVRDIAQARGLTLVLNQTGVALSPPQWNITNETMQRLNKALPAVKL